MPSPSLGGSTATVVHRVRRIAFWILGVDFVVMGALGIWLAFQYQPDDSAASAVHGALGLVAVVAALVAASATVADRDRSTAGILPAVVVLAVIAGMYLTGPTLAWDRIARESSDESRGIVVAFADDVDAIGQDDLIMAPGEYQRVAWLHAGALPLAVIAMGAAGLWAARRRQAYVPKRAITESGDANALS